MSIYTKRRFLRVNKEKILSALTLLPCPLLFHMLFTTNTIFAINYKLCVTYSINYIMCVTKSQISQTLKKTTSLMQSAWHYHRLWTPTDKEKMSRTKKHLYHTKKTIKKKNIFFITLCFSWFFVLIVLFFLCVTQRL